MKLSAYIIRVDSGFAPNPFGGRCTLACCKPAIRRSAERGDVIVATAASRYPHAGRLVYAMRVAEILTYQQYWEDPAYASRKPSPATPISCCGDNIWHQDPGGRWHVLPGAVHDESARERDTGGRNVLVATEFFYFGRDAIAVPPEFSTLLATTQGHKNTEDEDIIQRFWEWLSRTAPRMGRIGDPSEFTDEGCRAQCRDVEEDTQEAEPREDCHGPCHVR